MLTGGFKMDIDRAAEVVAAVEKFEVLYHDTPVWIKSVNKENGMAEVLVLGTKEEKKVAVADLNETGAYEALV
jgi:H-type small acid-soluble spore protein